MIVIVPYLSSSDFQAALNTHSGVNFFYPKPLQIASFIHFRKSQYFSGLVLKIVFCEIDHPFSLPNYFLNLFHRFCIFHLGYLNTNFEFSYIYMCMIAFVSRSLIARNATICMQKHL